MSTVDGQMRRLNSGALAMSMSTRNKFLGMSLSLITKFNSVGWQGRPFCQLVCRVRPCDGSWYLEDNLKKFELKIMEV